MQKNGCCKRSSEVLTITTKTKDTNGGNFGCLLWFLFRFLLFVNCGSLLNKSFWIYFLCFKLYFRHHVLYSGNTGGKGHEEIKIWQPFWMPSWIVILVGCCNLLKVLLIVFLFLKTYVQTLWLWFWHVRRQSYTETRIWRPFWTPSWISKDAQGGFSGTFSQWFYTYSWTYPAKISLLPEMLRF